MEEMVETFRLPDGTLCIDVDTSDLGSGDTYGATGIPRLAISVNDSTEYLDPDGAWVSEDVVDLVRACRAWLVSLDDEGLDTEAEELRCMRIINHAGPDCPLSNNFCCAHNDPCPEWLADLASELEKYSWVRS